MFPTSVLILLRNFLSKKSINLYPNQISLKNLYVKFSSTENFQMRSRTRLMQLHMVKIILTQREHNLIFNLHNVFWRKENPKSLCFFPRDTMSSWRQMRGIQFYFWVSICLRLYLSYLVSRNVLRHNKFFNLQGRNQIQIWRKIPLRGNFKKTLWHGKWAIKCDSLQSKK